MLKQYPKGLLLVMMIAGVISCVFGSWILYKDLKIINHGTQTMGIIEGYHSKRANQQSLTSKTLEYAPLFSYVTEDSVKFSTRSSIYKKEKSYEIGAAIPVRYDSENPKNAEIEGNISWIGSLALIGIGLFGCILFFLEFIKR